MEEAWWALTLVAAVYGVPSAVVLAMDDARIDPELEAEVLDEEAWDAAVEAYEWERELWLDEHAPELADGAPVHECLLLLPEDEQVVFEEFDRAGLVCGALALPGNRHAFGPPEEVIAEAAGRPADDGWVVAVCAALARERQWLGMGRRSMLLVQQGIGDMFHATATVNRRSIERYGLDWRRMGAAPGIAGNMEPEVPGIFVCDSLEAVSFFTGMARYVDVWAVDVSGLWLEGDPHASTGGTPAG